MERWLRLYHDASLDALREWDTWQAEEYEKLEAEWHMAMAEEFEP